MSITWNKIVADETALSNLVYESLKTLEADANWLYPKPMSGNSGITIGIGYDLKKCSDPVRIAVLQAMGLQTNLLTKNPEDLSASETIEVDYINQLWTLVQGTDLGAVNQKMNKRATDQELINAMTAEGKNYELRASFYFKDESEVRLVWDNGGYEDYKKTADGYVGSVINQTDYKLSKERVALFLLTWNNKILADSVGKSMQAGNRGPDLGSDQGNYLICKANVVDYGAYLGFRMMFLG